METGKRPMGMEGSKGLLHTTAATTTAVKHGCNRSICCCSVHDCPIKVVDFFETFPIFFLQLPNCLLRARFANECLLTIAFMMFGLDRLLVKATADDKICLNSFTWQAAVGGNKKAHPIIR